MRFRENNPMHSRGALNGLLFHVKHDGPDYAERSDGGIIISRSWMYRRRARSVPHASLRAKRSNPVSLLGDSLDCFVARAPRNDEFGVRASLTTRIAGAAKSNPASSLRAQKL